MSIRSKHKLIKYPIEEGLNVEQQIAKNILALSHQFPQILDKSYYIINDTEKYHILLFDDIKEVIEIERFEEFIKALDAYNIIDFDWDNIFFRVLDNSKKLRYISVKSKVLLRIFLRKNKIKNLP